jgi:hypothetical protein
MAYLIVRKNSMFDAFMRSSLPLWLTLSALYPIFVGLFIAKALVRMRRLRALRNQVAGVQLRSLHAWTEAQAKDWVPTR